MKDWLKKQVTELTAWAGAYIFFTGFVNLPFWLDCAVAVTLIAIDDNKATNFIKSKVPWLHKKIDTL